MPDMFDLYELQNNGQGMILNMMNVLLIGGNGFLGTHLQKYLVEKKEYNIFIIDINNSDYITPNIVFLSNTVNDLDYRCNSISIDIAVVLVHIKAENTANEVTININYCELVLQKLNNAGIKKVIYFSSGGRVYGNYAQAIQEHFPMRPICTYGITKLMVETYIERYCQVNQLDYLIVRPGNPYGSGQNVIGTQGLVSITLWNILRYNTAEIWGNGSEIRDYVYISDFCNAIELLLKSNKWNEKYNIGSGNSITTNHVLQCIKNITDLKFNVIYKYCKTPEIASNILDITKLNKNTGYTPYVTLQEGILSTYRFLLKQYKSEIPYNKLDNNSIWKDFAATIGVRRVN